MNELIFLAAWLIAGYVFTRFFVNHVLEDGRWSDTGTRVGVPGLLMITLVGPLMAVAMGVAVGIDWLFVRSGGANFVKRLYGIKDDDE